MKVQIKYILTVVLTCIFITTGIFLPEWMIGYTDKKILEKVKTETLKLPEFISDPDTSMIKKIGLLKDYPKSVNRVPLEMGMNFDLNSASVKFFEEITKLSNLGVLPEIGQSDKTAIKVDVSLFVQKDAPSVNAVLWDIVWQEDNLTGNFYLDDETGKIIQFAVTRLNKSFNIDMEAIEVWAKYLGLDVKNVELQPEANILWEKDENIMIAYADYTVYNFEITQASYTLPYTFYSFENGYGFGYIGKFVAIYEKNYVIITP